METDTAAEQNRRERPQISVIIPTRDRPNLLARSVTSALRQEGVSLEIVVVDDGSAAPVAKEAPAALNDHRVRIVRHSKSRGVSAARNSGIEAAEAPWLAFLDDDDLWAPTKLRAQLLVLEGHPDCAWSCTGDVWIDERLSVLGATQAWVDGDVTDLLLRSNCIPGGRSSVMMSTDLAREIKGFDEDLSMLADWDCWTRASFESELASVHVPLIAHMSHPSNMSLDTDRSMYEFTQMERKFRDQRRHRRLEVDRGTFLLWTAGCELRAGRRQAGPDLLAAAWHQRSPRTLLAGLGALVAPRALQRLVDAQSRRRLPDAVAREVEDWIGPLRRDCAGDLQATVTRPPAETGTSSS